jgi:hypothetical protein
MGCGRPPPHARALRARRPVTCASWVRSSTVALHTDAVAAGRNRLHRGVGKLYWSARAFISRSSLKMTPFEIELSREHAAHDSSTRGSAVSPRPGTAQRCGAVMMNATSFRMASPERDAFDAADAIRRMLYRPAVPGGNPLTCRRAPGSACARGDAVLLKASHNRRAQPRHQWRHPRRGRGRR